MEDRTVPADSGDDLSRDVGELFPEVGGERIDLEKHAPSVLVRALNDGSPTLRERVLVFYGLARARVLVLSRLNRLTNPAYRAYRERLGLPERDAGVTYMQSFWRP